MRLGGLPTPAGHQATLAAVVVSPLKDFPPAWGGKQRQRGSSLSARKETTWETFQGISCFPRNQEQGDAISQTTSGRTPGRQPPGQGVTLCPRDMRIPAS